MRGLNTSYKLITALLVGCFCLVTACENDVKEIDELLKKKTGVEEGINITSYLSQDAILKAKLTAPYMLRYMIDSSYIEFPRSLHVDFYDTTGKLESTLDALYAKYREDQRKVFLRDSVKVISIANGDTLKTSELWWDQTNQEFYTDKPVEVRQRDKVIFGKQGLRAAQNLSEYYFFGTSGTVITGPGGF